MRPRQDAVCWERSYSRKECRPGTCKYTWKGGGFEQTLESHPLLARLRRLANNPVKERNVWFLHERGGIDAASYDLVIRFLALGVIAQNPRQYGVSTEPLTF